ncbi:hypothetical protein KR032_011640 [Drosophila birchii]|nr:hypothetical protein KR032_011640 [Drosophila birchii]
MSSLGYILNLPMEVLDLVYKYIPDMKDKINLGKAHCVLGKAFVFHVRDIFKNICPSAQSISDWTYILRMCGSSVTGIRSCEDDNGMNVLKLATMYCPNLENISLIDIRNTRCEKPNVIDRLLQVPKLKILQLLTRNPTNWVRLGELVNLTKLDIHTFNEEEPVDIFKVCSPLKNIDTLELTTAFFRMPEDHADKELWPKIESLTVRIGFFPSPLPYLPTLKRLRIFNADRSTTLRSVFGQSIFDYGKTLEWLSFCQLFDYDFHADDLEIITKLKALKKFDCQVNGLVDLHYLCQLKNLEELNIQNSDITTRGAILLMNGCKKLHHLDLFGNPVDGDIIKKAVAAVNSLRSSSEKPLISNV